MSTCTHNAMRPQVLEKLQRRIRSVEVKVLNEPRPGKKCLVVSVQGLYSSSDCTRA